MMDTRAARVVVLAAVLAAAACGGVPSLPLDPAARTFFETARLVMTDAEQDIFRHLPDAEARREFIDDFWTKRDPDPETEANEFREEFDRRLEYVNKRFNEGRKGVNTDRGRVYFYLGPPEKTDFYQTAEGDNFRGPVLTWIYYAYDLGLVFADARGTGEYRFLEIQGDLLGAIETAKLIGFGAVSGSSRRMMAFETRYDTAKRQIVVTIPVKKLEFRVEAESLAADFAFTFYVYKGSGDRLETFEESRTFSGKAGEVEESKALTFTFPYELPPGRSYVDVVVNGGPQNGKVRKIFPVKG
jgi:GWxTD domain-containing protein